MRSFMCAGACVLLTIMLSARSTQARISQEPQPAGAAEAQNPGQQPKPVPKPMAIPPPAPTPGAKPAPEKQPEGRPVNIQIELTIMDQVESEPVQKKTVSLIVADRAFGRIRAAGQAPAGAVPGFVTVQLNVDARPAIQPNESIRLELTLEYRPAAGTSQSEASRQQATLNESLTVILQPGKPLTVSRAVDPFTNRRTSVDVTATIMK